MLLFLGETAMTLGAFRISDGKQLTGKNRRRTTLAAASGTNKKIRMDGRLDGGLKTANRFVLSDNSIPAHGC